MNQASCSKDRGDCQLAETAKVPPKRRKRNKDDSCGCGTSTTEESEPENKCRRYLTEDQPLEANQNRDDDLATVLDLEDEEDVASEDAPQCSCSLTVTDEDVCDSICDFTLN